MIDNYFLITICCFYTFLSSLNAQSEGEKIFSKNCAACHTVGGGKLIGPDLANIQDRRTEEWIIRFVNSSQILVKSGDSTANALFNHYNKIIMPDFQLTANEITSVIAYVKNNTPDVNNPNQKTPAQILSAASITPAEIERGKKLFEGLTIPANGGPACISCHNITNQAMFNGGLLAKDLTKAFSRLSAAGVDGILRNPPFPAMIDGFGSAPLTDQEVKALLAFLYYADSKGEAQSGPLETQSDLLIGIIVGLDIALMIILLVWQRVKKYSVNLI